MYCLDRNSTVDWSIFGSSEKQMHRRLDILFLPCTPKLKSIDNPDEKCTVDRLDKEGYAKKL
jgi:hypothetical protein